jgi:hypothetical protein
LIFVEFKGVSHPSQHPTRTAPPEAAPPSSLLTALEPLPNFLSYLGEPAELFVVEDRFDLIEGVVQNAPHVRGPIGKLRFEFSRTLLIPIAPGTSHLAAEVSQLLNALAMGSHDLVEPDTLLVVQPERIGQPLQHARRSAGSATRSLTRRLLSEHRRHQNGGENHGR